MAQITVKNLSKYYDKAQALKDVSFECKQGEFLAVLGPPGAGKTSLLKTIAGLEEANEGRIFFGDVDFTDIDPKDRDVAMAFESYALYPHMSVYENIAHPLKVRGGYTKDKIKEMVDEITGMLRINQLLDRKTNQLSGGQRQRVGMARALIREKPNVLLMDEPIAHLDASLRHWLRGELKRFLKQRGITTIYSTPDYLEAMAMGDRVIVLNEGEIKQIGSPEEILYCPKCTVVASYIGDPPINIIPVKIVQENNQMFVNIEGNKLSIPPSWQNTVENFNEILIGLRPTDLIIHEEKEGEGFEASVYVSEPLQRKKVITLKIGSYLIKVNAPVNVKADIGDNVWVEVKLDTVLLFDPKTNLTIINVS